MSHTDPKRCEHPYLNRIYVDEGEATAYYDCGHCGMNFRFGSQIIQTSAPPTPRETSEQAREVVPSEKALALVTVYMLSVRRIEAYEGASVDQCNALVADANAKRAALLAYIASLESRLAPAVETTPAFYAARDKHGRWHGPWSASEFASRRREVELWNQGTLGGQPYEFVALYAGLPAADTGDDRNA